MPDDLHSDDETSINKTESRGSGSDDATAAFDTKQSVSANSFGQPLQPGETLGRYEILECLDRGGMGVVYRARHTALGKQVALKVVSVMMQSDPHSMDRFLREMQAIGCLEPHPHVLTAYDAGSESGVQYIATELIDGMHLGSLVSRIGPLSVSEACRIIGQAASALDHLRNHQLVHRDVKPNNLMLTRDGTVKIVDMGLALLREEQAERLTLAGEAMGSVDYIAPEQWRDSHEVDWRSDIYSLGCTFYYLLAGRAPFYQKNRNSYARMQAHLEAEFPDICKRRNDVPDAASKLLLSMVAKNPDDRFTDLSAISEQLNVIASGDLKGLVSRGFTAKPRQKDSDFSPAPPSIPQKESAPQKDSAPRKVLRGSKQPADHTQETVASAKPSPALMRVPGRRQRVGRVLLAAALVGTLASIGVLLTLNNRNESNPFGLSATAIDTNEEPNSSDDPMAASGTTQSPSGVIVESTDPSVISCVGHLSKVKGLTFIDDQRLGSVSEKGILCLFELSNPTSPTHTVQVCERAASSIVYLAKEQAFLIGCDDGSLQLRSGIDGSEVHSEGGKGGLTDAMMIPNSTLVAATGWNGTVRLMETGSTPWETRSIEDTDEAIFDLDVTPDARKLVWAGRKPGVGVFDLKTEDMAVIAGQKNWLFAVAVSPDGKLVASGGQDNLVQIANLESGQTVSTLQSIVPQAIEFLPDFVHLAVAGRRGVVEIWDWEQANLIAEFDAEHSIDCIAVSPSGKKIAAGTVNGSVLVWPLTWTSTNPLDAL